MSTVVGEELFIDPFPAAKAFFHTVPKLDGGFAETPAEVHFLVLVESWEIDEAGVRVLDEHTRFLNFFELPFQARKTLVPTGLDGIDAAVVYLRAAHHHDVLGERAEFAVGLLVFLAETQKFA